MLNVQIQEYDVPTPKSRPHDPALAPDGSLWYTGQGANKLGRLDPKTGEFKAPEYPVAGERGQRAVPGLLRRSSGPHSEPRRAGGQGDCVRELLRHACVRA